MSSFDECCDVERRAYEILTPWIEVHLAKGGLVFTNKGRLSEFLQRSVGDLLYNSRKDGSVRSIEIKAEEQDKYGNAFLETYSNASRFTPGWMHTLNADLLGYFFLDTRKFYLFDYQRLRHWAFRFPGRRGPNHLGRLWDFPEREQGKRVQLNDTWGRCVPLSVLCQEVACKVVLIPRLDEPDAVPVEVVAPGQQSLFRTGT